MQHPGHLMRRALQVMNVLWSKEVSHTITSPQFAALNALHREPNIDQRTLGERISLDRSTMAEVVARLTARGLIRGERHSSDGRRKTIRLTPKGYMALQQLIPATHTMTGRLVGALDEQEQAELLRLLGVVVGSNERTDGQRPVRKGARSASISARIEPASPAPPRGSRAVRRGPGGDQPRGARSR
jgi:MarR family transcriptional regulator, temperature-dependent positive regulator of motility